MCNQRAGVAPCARDKVVAVDGLDAGEVRRMLEAATL